MTTVVMTCPVTGCNAGEGTPYKTEKVSETTAVAMLKMHVDISHRAAGTVQEGRPQAERVKRPALTLTGQAITLEDFDHFAYQYSQYKERLKDNSDNASRLRECLEDVSKMLYSSLGSEIFQQKHRILRHQADHEGQDRLTPENETGTRPVGTELPGQPQIQSKTV